MHIVKEGSWHMHIHKNDNWGITTDMCLKTDEEGHAIYTDMDKRQQGPYMLGF